MAMDQQAINLAKAIRNHESGGNFDAIGKSGESGAYQWMPETWKSHAGQILGDPNAEMSRDNQNAVAYGMIKTMKDSGLNVAEIAATWNSGSSMGWENKIGVNRQGVPFNVPAYVKSVTDNYQGLKAETLAQQPEVEPSGILPEDKTVTPGGLITGAGKAVVRTALGAGTILQEAGQRILAVPEAVTEPGFDFNRALEDVKERTGLEAFDEKNPIHSKMVSALKNDNLGEFIGGVGAEIGMFLTPAGAVSKAGKLSNTVRIASVAAGDGALAAAQSRGEGMTEEESMITAFLTGALSGTFGAAGVGIKNLRNLSSKGMNKALENTKKGLTLRALGATAADRFKGVKVPTDEFIKQNKLMGNLGAIFETSEQKIKNLSKVITSEVEKTQGQTTLNLINLTANMERNLVKDFGAITSDEAIQNLLDKTWKKYGTKITSEFVESMKGKTFRDGVVQLKTINDARKGLDKAITAAKFSTVIKKGEQGALNEASVLMAIRRELSELVKKAAPKTKEPFKEISNWIKVRNLAEKAISKEEASSGIDFFEALIAAGGFATGLPVGGLAIIGARKTIKNPKVILLAADISKKISKNLPQGVKIAQAISLIPEGTSAKVMRAVMLELIKEFTESEQR